jgi:hypothetical protein
MELKMENQNQNQNQDQNKPQSRFPGKNDPRKHTALVRLSKDAMLVREDVGRFSYIDLVTRQQNAEVFEQLQGECILDVAEELERNITEPFYQTALFRLASLRGTNTNITEALFEIFEYLPDDFAGRERRRFKEILKKVFPVIVFSNKNGGKNGKD